MSDMIMQRREFVSACARGCAGLLTGGCVAMVTHPVPIQGDTVRLPVAAYPELARAGGAIKIQPSGMADPVLVLAASDGFLAVSPICTHRGCTVDVQGDRLVCPCHGSTYDRTGRVLRGPAQRALARYPVTRSGDELVIELGVAR